MCGLVSIITKNHNGFTKDQVDAFNNLLYIDSLRGMDSTGTFMVEKNGDMEWAKEAVSSPVFCGKKEYRDLLNTAYQRGRALVGHNRAATRGTVTDENAHPFSVDNRITLVHNGTLWGNHRDLANVEVDSHAIAHVIHENGDDVAKAMKKIRGAYALIWHDHKNNTLNFLRNDQRPLHFVETTNAWIWASEANMISWILARYDSFKLDPNCAGPALLEAGCHVVYDFKDNSYSVDTQDIDITPEIITSAVPMTRTPHTPVRNMGTSYWPGAEEDTEDLRGFYSGQGTPSCSTPPLQVPFVPKQTTTNVVAPIKSSTQNSRTVENMMGGFRATQPRIIQEEFRIARDCSIDLSNDAFIRDHGVIGEGTWVTGECLDAVWVAKDSAEYGSFLYAKLKSHPNYLIRAHVQPNVSEYALLELTLNGREARFLIQGRSWRRYQDASYGQHGIGIVVASECQFPKELEIIKDEKIGVSNV